MPAREGEPYLYFFFINENFEFRAKELLIPSPVFVTLLLSKPLRHLRPIYIIV